MAMTVPVAVSAGDLLSKHEHQEAQQKHDADHHAALQSDLRVQVRVAVIVTRGKCCVGKVLVDMGMSLEPVVMMIVVVMLMGVFVVIVIVVFVIVVLVVVIMMVVTLVTVVVGPAVRVTVRSNQVGQCV